MSWQTKWQTSVFLAVTLCCWKPWMWWHPGKIEDLERSSDKVGDVPMMLPWPLLLFMKWQKNAFQRAKQLIKNWQFKLEKAVLGLLLLFLSLELLSGSMPSPGIAPASQSAVPPPSWILLGVGMGVQGTRGAQPQQSCLSLFKDCISSRIMEINHLGKTIWRFKASSKTGAWRPKNVGFFLKQPCVLFCCSGWGGKAHHHSLMWDIQYPLYLLSFRLNVPCVLSMSLQCWAVEQRQSTEPFSPWNEALCDGSRKKPSPSSPPKKQLWRLQSCKSLPTEI